MTDANTLPENSLCQRAANCLIIDTLICICLFAIRLEHCVWMVEIVCWPGWEGLGDLEWDGIAR